MDTNARKNRSGTWMERRIEGHLSVDRARHPDAALFRQKSFARLEKLAGIQGPPALANRQFDLVYADSDCWINIEVNFYSGGGSKPQEIIDSYIDRQRQLVQAGWSFILATDGAGWLAGKNQLKRGISELDFLMNLNFVRAGLLEAAVEACYES